MFDPRQVKLHLALILYMRLFWEADALPDVCRICVCFGSSTDVVCIKKNLTSVPQNIHPNVEHLNLQSNKISNIKGSFNRYTRLRKLTLSRNEISNIQSGTFSNLFELRTLDLSSNKISNFEQGTFKDLLNLRNLNLENNKLTIIKKGYFGMIPNLHHLELASNEISNIEKGTFSNLFELRTLTLSRNEISNIQSGTFSNLFELRTLDLSSNKISNFEQGTFKDLLNIRRRLSRNKTLQIEQGTSTNIIDLYNSDLSENVIRKYEDGAFLFLPKIEMIDLSSNNYMACGCHLPALVDYINSTQRRNVTVPGVCHTNLGNKQDKVIPITEYSQCENYSLFQKNLQCQECSRMPCSDSEVKRCTESEPVCQYRLSMNGVTLKFERSCSSYRNCIETMENNSLTFHKWTNGSSRVACCTGDLCNKNGFMGWTNSFVFHLIYNSTLKTFRNSFEIHRAIEYELLKVTGAFEVEYCGFEKSSVIYTIFSTTLITSDKDQVLQELNKTLPTSHALSIWGIQQSKVKLIGDMYCNEDTTSITDYALVWPMTKVGMNATIPCNATRQCSSRRATHPTTPLNQNITSLKCSPFTGIWLEPDMSRCKNAVLITQQLKDMRNEGINKGNVEKVSTKIRDMSENSVSFEEEAIGFAVDIIDKMVPLISIVSVNVTLNNVLPSINNMIDTPKDVLVGAEQSNGSVNRMLDIIETIAEEIPLEGQQVTASYSNLGIGVAKVEKDTFNGLVYAVSYGTNETKNEIYNDSNSQEDTMDSISLPKSLLKNLTDDERSNISRILFLSMNDDKLYRIIQGSGTKAQTTINSHVITAAIPNVNITNLDEPIQISFKVIDKNTINTQCVYWDKSFEQNPHWSTKGCKISKYVPGERVFCSCNHLTSFALLMDVYQNQGGGKDSQVLSIISNIGCGISFVCLILTIIIHAYFKNLWKSLASKILVNLCSSLAATYLIFLVGFQGYSAKVMVVCKAVAALLHYFLLTSFLWMAVEALHIFLGVVVVFKTFQESFMRRTSIVVWGLPAVIVIITLAINYTNNYIRIGQVCWLSKTAFYAGFLAPVALFLLFNLTMFSLVIWRLNSMQNDKKFEVKRSKVRVFGIIGLCFLLGFTWLLAFFAFGEAAVVFNYLFAIFNTLQGMFIFIVYCLCKEDVRDIIYPYLCKQKPRKLRDVQKNIKSSSSGNETESKTVETNAK